MSIAGAAISGLQCEVWQPQGLYETPYSSSSSSSVNPAELFIDFYVFLNEGDEQMTRSLGYKNFRQRCTQDSFSWSTISWMLSQTNVPYHLQPFFIQHISITARRIATQPNNALSPTIPIIVDLILPIEEEEDTSSGSRFVNGLDQPSVASIEDILLERVDDGSDNICVICLDEISISNKRSYEFDDIDAYAPVRMACCFHVYHRCCIRKWLQLNNPCPLCRRSHIMPNTTMNS